MYSLAFDELGVIKELFECYHLKALLYHHMGKFNERNQVAKKAKQIMNKK